MELKSKIYSALHSSILLKKLGGKFMILDLTRRTLWTFLIMRISFASDCMDFSYFSDSSVRTRLTDMGILICGSGQGMAMRANKWNHVRAALCWTQKSRLSVNIMMRTFCVWVLVSQTMICALKSFRNF